MATEDSHLTRIDPTFTWLDTDVSWPRKNIGFSQLRWNEYRDLFRELDLDNGVWRSESYPGVMLIVSSTGMLGRETCKGYVYSTQPLEHVLDSLDDPAILPCAGKKDCMVYTRLKDSWYLFYEIG